MASRYLLLLFCLTSLSAQTSLDVSPNLTQVTGAYCSGCHNGRTRSPSGILLDQFDTARISANREVWSRAYRQLQAGTMPPAGAPRPDRATYDAILTSLEQALGSDGKSAAANSQEVATRLATFLWSSVPDTALLEEARRNRLTEAATLERQIRRMLADDRAQAFVARFFFPWLQLDQLGESDPDKRLYPDYEVTLRNSLAKETELFLLSQLRDDRDPIELWSANYTLLNEELARHYGIPNVRGPAFRRVKLPGPERAGLLGHGSILMLTSKHQDAPYAAYTSPATRGKWVRMHFLGVPPPNPFPGAGPPPPPELPIAGQTRAFPADPCVTCHRNFFPLGYALENFDPLGRWRTRDQAGVVDASGTFVDGTSTNGVVELRRVLLQRPEAFRTTITERLLAYSAGSAAPFRGTPETLTQARRILRGVPKPRWSALIAAIVRTGPLATE